MFPAIFVCLPMAGSQYMWPLPMIPLVSYGSHGTSLPLAPNYGLSQPHYTGGFLPPPDMFKFVTPANEFGEGNVFTGVCLFTGGRYITCIMVNYLSPPGIRPWDLPLPLPTSDLGTYPYPHCWHLVVITRNLFKLVYLRTYPTPQPALISSGGHWNTYGWQVGGTRPTGMLSCSLCSPDCWQAGGWHSTEMPSCGLCMRLYKILTI